MGYSMTPHTVTLFNAYTENRDTKYKRTVIENCKFTPKKAVSLGNIRVEEADTGKLFVYEDNINMNDYHLPKDFIGTGFTFKGGDFIVVGEAPDINSVSDLKNYEHYTISSVNHVNYTRTLKYHFVIEVK